MRGLTVLQEEFRDTVAEAGLEVAELALLVLEGAECGDARVSGPKTRQAEREARKEELVAFFSRKAPVGSQIANGV
jgi:hypothetical protein